MDATIIVFLLFLYIIVVWILLRNVELPGPLRYLVAFIALPAFVGFLFLIVWLGQTYGPSVPKLTESFGEPWRTIAPLAILVVFVGLILYVGVLPLWSLRSAGRLAWKRWVIPSIVIDHAAYDDDPQIRMEAVWALASNARWLGDHLNTLLDVLAHDSDPEVRRAAAKAISGHPWEWRIVLPDVRMSMTVEQYRKSGAENVLPTLRRALNRRRNKAIKADILDAIRSWESWSEGRGRGSF